MKKLLMILALMKVVLTAHGQSAKDSITLYPSLGSYEFFQNGHKLSFSKLTKTMKSNEQAYKEIKTAQDPYIIATILGSIGGGAIGWYLGGLVGGKKSGIELVYIGGGLIIVSIPLIHQFNKHALRAVDLYNQGLKSGYNTKINPELKLGFTRRGVGLFLEL